MAIATAVATGRLLNPWRVIGWGLAAVLLLTPAVAMRFSDEVKWTDGDFLFAGLLIGAVGLGAELTVRASRNGAYRIAAALAILAGSFLIWVNAAVGIIGDPGNPLNRLYVGVLAIGLGGVIGAGGRAAGMARAMAATALAQLPVAVIAVVVGGREPPGRFGQVLLNSCVLLFIASAVLFARAARQQTGR